MPYRPGSLKEIGEKPAGGQQLPGSENCNDPEILNINSIFGGIKRFICSKNFKGGSIVTFMGGAEINLMQADIIQPIIIEVSNLFGGTKLILPSNWDIKNEVTVVFGGVEDKRNMTALSPDPGKTVYLKGNSLFGGIELNKYKKGNKHF